MNKQQVSIKLEGMVPNPSGSYTIAKAHQASQVRYFIGTDERVGQFRIDVQDPTSPVLVTGAGSFPLVKHESQNYWTPVKSTRPVHVILKKITGQLIYWA